MVNTQEWLDKEYPLETRSEIKELNISRKDLKRWLNLSGFINLEKLDCSFNNVYLQLNDCSNLVELDCSYNQLSRRDFLMGLPSPRKLIKLNLLGNDFKYKWDLDVWHHFFNLLEFNGEKRKQWVIRNWYGLGLPTEWEWLQEGCERLDNEAEKEQSKNRTLQSQLNAKEVEISWLKEQLKKAFGENEYQTQIEANYPEKFL